MRLRSLHRNTKQVGNLFDTVTLRIESQHGPLALGQVVKRRAAIRMITQKQRQGYGNIEPAG